MKRSTKVELAIKAAPIAGKVLLLLCVAFILVMFGLRFVTLRFGQVFPDQSAADREKLATLDARLAEMQEKVEALESAKEKISDLEQENQRLSEALQEKPKVVYETVEVPAPTPGPTPEPDPTPEPTPRLGRNVQKGSKVEPATGEVVHRGDSMEKVRQVFGRPESVYSTSFTQTEHWVYSSGSITFKKGVVSEWRGMPVEP